MQRGESYMLSSVVIANEWAAGRIRNISATYITHTPRVHSMRTKPESQL